jgi:hypothetical protein
MRLGGTKNTMRRTSLHQSRLVHAPETWTVEDAEILLSAFSKWTSLPWGPAGYAQLRREHQHLPTWEDFVALLAQSQTMSQHVPKDPA